MTFTNQDLNTEATMAAIQAEREQQSMTRKEITERLRETFDITMSEDKYKACEIGLTKHIPFYLIAALGHILMMPSEMIMPLHNTDEYRAFR